MNFDVRKRKSWNEGGVSEVIGNILILMMTVVLFSGIIAFVQQMPVPEQATKADFAATIAFSSNYRHANLTVTHAGGKVLMVNEVRMIVQVNNTKDTFLLTTDANFKGVQWNTGKSWTKQLDNTNRMSNIVVTVFDSVKSSAIWTSQVTGGAGGAPPSILQRWVDSNWTTSTPDPVKQYDDFRFYATIQDPDNDLNTTNGIWIDSSNIEGSSFVKRWPSRVNGNTYEWDFLDIKGRELSADKLDGAQILVHAWDMAGHQTISSFVMTVTMLPSDTYDNWYAAYTDIGTSGLPSYLSYVSGGLGHGFGIYGENKTNGSIMNGIYVGKANTNNATRDFWKESNVFIRFASLSMKNVYSENRLSLIETRTGITYTPVFAGSSTSTLPFYPYPTGGSAYVYECVFNTTGLPPSAYTVAIYLKSQPGADGLSVTFQGNQMITVNQIGTSISFIPKLLLFKEDARTNEWGTRDHPFEISSTSAGSTYTIYASVDVLNTDTAPKVPRVSEIRISDMGGGSEVYGVPPAGGMISSMSRENATRYKFSIDLRMNNGDQWIGGTNSYTLYVSKFNDTNEGMYSLSAQVWIKSSAARADFIVGTSGMAGGNGNFNSPEYLFYVQNNNFFTWRALWKADNTPSSSSSYTVTAIGVGDVDGDGDKDILMGQQGPAGAKNLVLFENTLTTFGTWQVGSTLTRPDLYTYPVTSIAFGDSNGDGHPDFAYANSNSQIVIWNTTYGSTGWIYNPLNTPTAIKWSGTIAKIDLRDMTGDGRADLIVLAGGILSIYDLRYSYDSALKSQENLKARFAYTTTTGTVDFDIVDMDNDSYMDILTVGTTGSFGGNAGPNVNYYTVGTGNKVTLNSGMGGLNPRVDYGETPIGSMAGTTDANDGQTIEFRELTTGVGQGKLMSTMITNTLTASPDQELRVRAKIAVVGGGTPTEDVYVWYSLDDSTYVPVITIYNNRAEHVADTYYDYSFMLPSSVMSKAVYIRFSDSLVTAESSSPQERLVIDLCAVYNGTFGGYTQSIVISSDNSWKAIRAANIDNVGSSGKSYREVVVSKDAVAGSHVWKVYAYSGATWTAIFNSTQDDTFIVNCPTSKVSDFPADLAPTMFDAVDVNGDGFTDILTVNYTTSGSNTVNRVGYFMNLWSNGNPSWRYYSVREWALPTQPGGESKNPWVDIVMAANVYTT